MSKRPVPNSPQPNPKPTKARLTASNQQNASRSVDTRPVQANAKVLNDKTNVPKGKSGKGANEGSDPKENPEKSAKSAPKATTASKPATKSKPTVNKNKKTAEEIVVSDSDDGGNGGSDDDDNFEYVPEGEGKNDGGSEDDDDDEGEPEEPLDAVPRGAKPRARVAKSRAQRTESDAQDPAEESTDKPKKKRGRPPKAMTVGAVGGKAKISTNRAPRKSVALTTPAARDMVNGLSTFLNQWAKCSELHILKQEKECEKLRLEKEKAQEERHLQREIRKHLKSLKEHPESIRNFYQFQKDTAERRRMEVEQKGQVLDKAKVDQEIELYRLRDKVEALEKEKKGIEQKAQEERERQEAERFAAMIA